MDEWTTFRLNGDAMERLASPEAAGKISLEKFAARLAEKPLDI
jgi:hypothetical protein